MKYHYQERVIIPFAKSHKRLVTAMVAVIFAFMWTVGLLARVNAAPAVEVDVYGDSFAGTAPGWLFNRDTNNATPIEFNTDESTLGNGSLYVEPLSSEAARKFIGELFLAMPAEDLNSISYDFMIAGSGDASDANEFYLNVYVNLPSSSTWYDCKYDYVPDTGSTGAFTTAVFDSTDDTVTVTDRYNGTHPDRPDDGYDCADSLAQMADDQPGSTVSFVSINMGDTGNQDAGLAGYFDRVIVDSETQVTTYDLEPLVESVEITSPADGDTVSGLVPLMATYVDTDSGVDPVFWAVREGATCNVGGTTVYGNVDGRNDDEEWNGSEFAAYFDSTMVNDGVYCFVINPDGNNNNVRAVVSFEVDNRADTAEECKKGGWELGLDLDTPFRNQGDCVSHFSSDTQANRNPDGGRNANGNGRR